MNPQKDQTCMECGASFTGRTDKKYCSDQCRATSHNRLKSQENDYIRDVNNILRKNRKILMQCNPDGKSRVSLSKLRLKGFDFDYYTSTYTTREGAKYFYCYEQGYLLVDKDQCLLVVKKDYSQTM